MRDSMVIYTAYADKFKRLTNEQFGLLIRLMMDYQNTGVIPEIDDFAVSLAFDVVKFDIDMNAEKYDSVVQRNQENGKKGGRPRKNADSEEPNGINENPQEPKKPTGFFENPKEPKKADNDNDNENDNDIKKEKIKREKFIPPSVDEVRAYCRERNNSVDPERFTAFYASKGWKVGKSPMKDWKAAVRTWERPQNASQSGGQDKNPFMRRNESDILHSIEEMAMRGIGG